MPFLWKMFPFDKVIGQDGLPTTNIEKSAFMESCDSLTTLKEELSRPDVVNDADFKSIPFATVGYDDMEFVNQNSSYRSFLLLDANENLHIATPEVFCKKLMCSDTNTMKVVSIFGNTGDGKSHTMNHIFFNGEEVFKCSPEQKSCTLGVYAALQVGLGVLCLDTEGLLSINSQSSRRTRILLKIMAISDIVIYRTRSERLHSDLYEFLGAASKAFNTHFLSSMQINSISGCTPFGPALIIFHETRYTKPLQNSVDESAEEKLRENFSQLGYDISAFSSLRYLGLQTSANKTTDYSKLLAALKLDLENNSVRSARKSAVILQALQELNNKFCEDIAEISTNPIPDYCLTCTEQCASCNVRCQLSMSHDKQKHLSTSLCVHKPHLGNKVDFCKICDSNGREAIVTYVDTWTCTIINCPNCGEIGKNWKYWGGNSGDDMVCSKIVHIWKDDSLTPRVPMHSGQIMVDHVSYVCEALSNISNQPTEAIKEWCADKFAPTYWKPNSEIINCFSCKKNFEKLGLRKHHCRGCGEGFCDICSQHRMPVPARKWLEPVRVCNDCRDELQRNPKIVPGQVHTNEDTEVTVRKCGETLYNTVTKVATVALECTKEIIKQSARPDYWIPDTEATSCLICKIGFGTTEELLLSHMKSDAAYKTFKGGDGKRHHCRKCGMAVCADCSKGRAPVPERGWITDVRICDICVKTIQGNAKTKTA